MSAKTWIFPIAGNGTRTKTLGKFKPFIEVSGKTILEWFLISIFENIDSDDDFIFVTTQAFEDEFQVTKMISHTLQKVQLHNNASYEIVLTTPDGPAKSVEAGLKCVTESHKPVVIANVDQYILFSLPEDLSSACYLVANIDLGESKSYIYLDNKEVTQVVEKINVSNVASTGIYTFPNQGVLAEALERLFETKKMTKSEYYISTAMNEIINDYDFGVIPALAKLDLGTELNVKYFEKTVGRIKD
ncbi:hypothetical protein [Vibrio sp. CyArs1]|uniref:hypothetical protein n=1 Tax=Vibrio sp. CyArs1 TaxID=2682577 RepID=UPI001F062D69|nr:hypothetical protein [Vibrio sp. CyArs1]